VGRAAGQVEDDLDILPAGVEDLQHLLIVHEQLEQRREVEILGLGIDRRGFGGGGDLDQAQVRPIAVLAHELGIDRDERLAGETAAQVGERVGGGDQG
jgi:hypothetical protein